MWFFGKFWVKNVYFHFSKASIYSKHIFDLVLCFHLIYCIIPCSLSFKSWKSIHSIWRYDLIDIYSSSVSHPHLFLPLSCCHSLSIYTYLCSSDYLQDRCRKVVYTTGSNYMSATLAQQLAREVIAAMWSRDCHLHLTSTLHLLGSVPAGHSEGTFSIHRLDS